MDYILERTIDATEGGEQFNFNPGRVAGIRLVFSGTNAAATTGTLNNLGSIIVKRAERQIANVSVRQLVNMLDINRGSNLFSSTEASTFLASATLDFFLRGDASARSALEITGQSELNFEYVPASDTATTFDSLTLKVYSEKAAYNEQYELWTLRDNQNEDSAVASKSYQLNKTNIVGIYLEDIDDVIDSVQLQQSDRTVLSPVDWDLLETVTVGSNQIEDGASDMVKIPTYSPNNLGSAENRDTILYLTTSAGGTIDIVTQSIH